MIEKWKNRIQVSLTPNLYHNILMLCLFLDQVSSNFEYVCLVNQCTRLTCDIRTKCLYYSLHKRIHDKITIFLNQKSISDFLVAQNYCFFITPLCTTCSSNPTIILYIWWGCLILATIFLFCCFILALQQILSSYLIMCLCLIYIA